MFTVKIVKSDTPIDQFTRILSCHNVCIQDEGDVKPPRRTLTLINEKDEAVYATEISNGMVVYIENAAGKTTQIVTPI